MEAKQKFIRGNIVVIDGFLFRVVEDFNLETNYDIGGIILVKDYIRTGYQITKVLSFDLYLHDRARLAGPMARILYGG